MEIIIFCLCHKHYVIIATVARPLTCMSGSACNHCMYGHRSRYSLRIQWHAIFFSMLNVQQPYSLWLPLKVWFLTIWRYSLHCAASPTCWPLSHDTGIDSDSILVFPALRTCIWSQKFGLELSCVINAPQGLVSILWTCLKALCGFTHHIIVLSEPAGY